MRTKYEIIVSVTADSHSWASGVLLDAITNALKTWEQDRLIHDAAPPTLGKVRIASSYTLHEEGD
jgi:hypothetical protein